MCGSVLFVAVGVCFILFSHPVKVVTPFCFTCPDDATASLRDHLHYEFDIPLQIKNSIVAFSVLYIAATIVTPFISSIKKMKWLGVVFLASYLFAITLLQRIRYLCVVLLCGVTEFCCTMDHT